MIPVRVRGKKYRQKPVSLRMTQKDGSLAQVSKGQRKRAASFSTPTYVPQKQARTDHNGTASETPSATSLLEQLPTEILEMIFLYSLNLSLPRSSLLLGGRLASNHMKTNLFLLVFPSRGDQLEHIEYLLRVLSTEDAIGKLQSDILSLKWVTPAFVRGMTETFMVRTIVRELRFQGLGWGEHDDSLKMGVVEEGRFENESSYFNPLEGVLDASKEATIDIVSLWYKHTVARRRSRQGPLFNFLECIWEVKGTNVLVELDIRLLEGQMMLKVFSEDLGVGKGILESAIGSRLIHCISNSKIPVKLLHGPWTAEKCDDLERICSGGGRIDQTGSTMDEEIAEAGLRDAIREGNQRAIVTLVGSVGSLEPPRNDTDEICEGCYPAWTSAEQRPNNHCQLNASFVGIAVVTDHIKLALSRDCSYSILYSLLHAVKVDIDWADTEITAWAVRKKREGDDRGQWLLDRIASLNALRYGDSVTRCLTGMRE